MSYNFFIYKIKNFKLICQKNIRAVNLKKNTKVNKWLQKFVKNLKVNMNLLLKKKKKEQKTIDLDKLMLEKIIIKKLMFLI